MREMMRKMGQVIMTGVMLVLAIVLIYLAVEATKFALPYLNQSILGYIGIAVFLFIMLDLVLQLTAFLVVNKSSLREVFFAIAAVAFVYVAFISAAFGFAYLMALLVSLFI